MLELIAKDYVDSPWTRITQDALLRDCIERGILDPYVDPAKATQNDRTALVRISKSFLEALGMLWSQDSLILTPAGLDFLTSPNPDHVIESQIAKYQYPNPALKTHYVYDFRGLIPHLFLLQVLSNVDYYISRDEWILFLNLAQAHSDRDEVVRYIRAWRALPEGARAHIFSVSQSIPIAQIEHPQLLPLTPTNPTMRWQIIDDSVSYQTAMFAFHKYLIREPGRVLTHERKTVNQVVGEEVASLSVPAFRSEPAWITYYGDPERRPSYYDSLLLAIEQAPTAEAASCIPVKSEELTAEERATVRRKQLEKKIEEYYSGRLDRIEPGLTLVDRQTETPIGKPDIVCRDASGATVIIEVKLGTAEDSAFGQLARYLGWFHRHPLANSNGDPRGIILAADFGMKAQFSRYGIERSRRQTKIKFVQHRYDTNTDSFQSPITVPFVI